MTLYYLLAFLIGAVVRSISRVALRSYIMTGETNDQLVKHLGFHITIVSYIVGSLVMYLGLAISLAVLVKTHILT